MTQELGNANFENFIGATEGFSEIAYQFTSHILTLGYAVMLAGLLYFILTIKNVDKKFQMSNILSAVVMVSAFLLLYAQAQNWTSSFTFNEEVGRYFLDPSGDLFNNGYRYLAWLIDVPMLLFQILFVVSLTTSKFSSVRNQFWFSGAMMIITGYIGQFYEVSNLTAFLVWGAISSAFFFHILWVMKKVINEGKEGISPAGQKILSNIWILFLISWTLYPGAYLMPYLTGVDGFLYSEDGVMARQLVYTIADVSSKVIYGVLLGNLAITLSKNKELVEANSLEHHHHHH
uniref:Sodium pumping rhodopsin n=1 Tax=Dokdonia eikasta TaxID=308116 RepID=UPI00157E339E|nr:Chain A, Sodium pumping rhodopsin [Dokdonia eikasta]6YT4_B Chain B, Sodium pumping rhodopsin [Dokdonia eikasta]6YT4_C Chain C, Sodium pumping rhodopsin [Dokdonia eikasta]6YT4_D Chain D, Sodium pumping rhodopsin [Dokdonia eikasta]6YT4_E Chain E, Sodium pumping rhodopsin [Dokdonia eikasta]